jgi:c-di-GMP-binding flagellar brake protein YcgR
MEGNFKDKERRRHKRVKVNFIIIYRIRKPLKILMFIGYKEVSTLMLDLSEGGMAIVTNYDIPVSGVMVIKFTLIDAYAQKNDRVRTMEITGEVRNNRQAEKGEYRLGVSFTQISEEDRLAIAKFVKSMAVLQPQKVD